MGHAPGDYDDQPGHLARRFQQIAVAVFHAEAQRAGFDLTPVQYVALLTVERRPDLDQATLAGLIAYDRTTITGVVDRLVQKGLATRRPSPSDRRARLLAITAEGRAVLAGIMPAVERAQQTLLRALSPEEAALFMAMMGRVVADGNELSRAPLIDAPAPIRDRDTRS